MVHSASGDGRPGLTLAERAAALGAALLVFAFGAGPVWRHAWNPDASILWSYAVIPALVLVLLGRRHALRLGSFLSESLVLSVFKFGITAMVLIGFWSSSAPPRVHRAERSRSGVGASESSAKGEEGEAGARRDAAPLGPASAPSAVVEIGAGKIVPQVIALVPAAPVAFRSSDGRLHALELLAPDGSVRANVPILASGSPRALSFEEVSRTSTLRCAIHPEETATISR